ncbi:esterase [Paenibacillus sp. 1011MAR3C5]|uniref:alpha/beta hydrolase n=1 Tax=Paenibacillus sp. 1011MAR3C5 TaxID=1675787 RepID=UPI000E6CB922|nr:dienelactone hydrolase family protein [Paenibacillus sp. 1011MAR3C5]RJE86212.1 esterase [Paenibacillus sp. 1011MAR3C5]
MIPAYAYQIHLPEGMETGMKYPTLFTLHGKGSNEGNMAGLTKPLEDRFITIHIRGDLLLGAGYQYYELKSLGNPLRESFDRAVQQLEAFIAYASEKYPVDTESRYLLGFSQGAILSLTLAHTLGNALRGIVALNGYIPQFVKTEYAVQSMWNVLVFVSHGVYDSVFPIRIGHETAEYMGSVTSKLTFKTYLADHGVTEENMTDYVSWLQQDAALKNDKGAMG